MQAIAIIILLLIAGAIIWFFIHKMKDDLNDIDGCLGGCLTEIFFLPLVILFLAEVIAFLGFLIYPASGEKIG